MPSQNGILKEVFISELIKEKIFYEIYLIETGAKIEDYIKEQVGIVFLKFNLEEEMIETAKKINKLIFPVVV